MRDHLVGHVSRDSTAIEGREQPTPKPEQPDKPKRKRGRPRTGEEQPKKEPRRLERQQDMTLPQMLEDLPSVCDVGVKRNAKGHQESWIGFKLHIDAADGGIPVSCVLTSASVHDSQVALPLATMTDRRVTNLYDLMDAAYDAPEIRAHSESLGHVPIIDLNPRSTARKLELKTAGTAHRRACVPRSSALPRALDGRARQRPSKDEFGARQMRPRSRQGAVPPDVRHPGADGGPVDTPAELNPTYRRICALPAGRHGTDLPAKDAASALDSGRFEPPQMS